VWLLATARSANGESGLILPPGPRRTADFAEFPGFVPGSGARWSMDTTLNYAIGAVLVVGALAVVLAVMIW
jgi:hypothetical protein